MKTEIKWGLIISTMIFLWVLMEFLLGFHTTRIELHPIITWFSLCIPIIGLIVALKEKREKDLGGTMSYIQALKSGFLISLVCGIMNIVWQGIYWTLVNPGYGETLVQHAREKLGEEAAKDAEQYANMNSYMVQSFVGALIGGLIISAIVGIFVKRGASKHA